MYIKRHIENAVLERAKMKGSVVVTGARQVWKTTLIDNLKPDITKVTFDDFLSQVLNQYLLRENRQNLNYFSPAKP